MKKLLIVACAVFALTLIPHDAHASSYRYDGVDPRIQNLLKEVARLQAELARIRGAYTGGECYTYGSAEYCYRTSYTNTGGTFTSSVRSIDAEYRNSAAYVTVEYRSGREREYIVGGADSDREVIEALTDVLDLSYAQINALISFSGDSDDDDDIDYIRVTIDRDDDEADARVRYEDGDTDRFTYDTDSKSEIIEELSDDLDIDEDDVEDLVDWSYDDSDSKDVDSIDATVYEDDERTNVRVEFDDNSVRFFTYYTDDEDDVIEDLADDLNIDEDEVEDLIDWSYRD